MQPRGGAGRQWLLRRRRALARKDTIGPMVGEIASVFGRLLLVGAAVVRRLLGWRRGLQRLPVARFEDAPVMRRGGGRGRPAGDAVAVLVRLLELGRLLRSRQTVHLQRDRVQAARRPVQERNERDHPLGVAQHVLDVLVHPVRVHLQTTTFVTQQSSAAYSGCHNSTFALLSAED